MRCSALRARRSFSWLAINVFPGGILLGFAQVHLPLGCGGVSFLLFGFERGSRFISLAARRIGPEVFPFLVVLRLDLVIGGLARAGIELFGPCLVVKLGDHLGFSKSVAIAFLLFVKGFSRRRLGLQKIVPFLPKGRKRRQGKRIAGLVGLGGFCRFFLPVGLDDLVVVLNAAHLVEQAVGYRAIASATVMAIEVMALFFERLRLRPDRNLRLAVDPLLFERARIVADIEAGALHDLVEMIAPPLAQVVRRRPGRNLPAMLLRFANVFGAGGRADNLAAGVDIRVLENDMRMRVMRILAFFVIRRAPGDAALTEILHEGLDGFVPLFRGKLARKSDHELVADPGIFRHARLFPELVEKHARAAAAVRHVLGLKVRSRLGAHDVAHMRCRRALLMRLGADAAVLEGGKRFADS